jgi:hypothetical protein
MPMKSRALNGAVLALALASCGGHAGLPPATTPAALRTAAPKGAAAVALTVVVPHPATASARRRPAYVSPSSATLVVAVNGGAAASYGLTSTSPGCSLLQGNTQCVLQVPGPAGDDSLALTIEDGAGNVLSKNIVNAKLVAGQSTPVNVTLAGIPASVAIVPGSGSAMEDSANPAWHVPGLLPQPVEVEALDADGNVIIGPGAPTIGTPTVSAGASFATIVSAQTTDPNAYLLKATSGKAGGQTVTIGATSQSIKLSDGTESAPVTSSTNFLYTPAMAIVSGSIVSLYSVETTNLLAQFGACGGSCFGLTFATNMASDPNGDLFVETFSSLGLSQTSTVYVFPAGSLAVSEVYGSSNGVAGGSGISADAQGTLYAANGVSYTGSFPNRHSVPASLDIFAWGATAPTTSLTDAGPTYLTGPMSTALDATGHLYILNQDDSIDVYPTSTQSITPTTVIEPSGISEPAGMAVDANGGIYVTDIGNSDIAYIAPGSTTVTNTIFDSSFYNLSGGIWFDGNGNLNVSLSNETEILAGSGLPSGTVTNLGYYPAAQGYGAWIP